MCAMCKPSFYLYLEQFLSVSYFPLILQSSKSSSLSLIREASRCENTAMFSFSCFLLPSLCFLPHTQPSFLSLSCQDLLTLQSMEITKEKTRRGRSRDEIFMSTFLPRESRRGRNASRSSHLFVSLYHLILAETSVSYFSFPLSSLLSSPSLPHKTHSVMQILSSGSSPCMLI